MRPDRVWTNSWAGRLIGAAFGLVVVLVSFTSGPGNGPAPWHGTEAIIDVGVVLFAAVVNVSLWTARLVLVDGLLTATNFGVSRSVPIVDVKSARGSWVPLGGIVIHGSDRTIRSLVTAYTRDGGRVTTICRQVEAAAEAARSRVRP